MVVVSGSRVGQFGWGWIWLLVVFGVVLGWLAVPTAAEGTSGFDDVTDSSVHAAGIAALESEGLLEGTECVFEGSAVGFCPDDPLLRSTMAVWIVRAVDGGDPLPAGESRFADIDPGMWWVDHVEKLADLGITAGCSTTPARYCPGDSVSRAQMASFLVRAFGLEAAPSAGFTDTVGNVHAANVDALAAAGITAGCSTTPPQFCPDSSVNRGQMATLLARALELIPLPDTPEQVPPTETEIVAAEAEMAALVNELRRSVGQAPLSYSTGLAEVARRWSQTMYRQRIFYHNPDYSRQYPPGWLAAGENIARAEVHYWSLLDHVQKAFENLVASPGHYANMVRPEFNSLGVGIVFQEGSFWVTQNFAQYPSGVTTTVASDRPVITYIAWSDTGQREVWAANADGTGRVNLVESGQKFEWSPNYRHIAYRTSLPNNELWVVAADGSSNPIKLTDAAYTQFRWSPNNRHIAYRYGGLWVVAADGSSNPIKLTDHAHTQFRWSPNSRHIAYKTPLLKGELWVVAADGSSNPIKLTDDSHTQFRWSPNSRHIIYTGPDEIDELWAVAADGSSNPIKLADNFNNDNGNFFGIQAGLSVGGWSPDGRYIAYRSLGLWVAAVDGSSDPVRLNGVDDGFGRLEEWSPDSRRITYSLTTDTAVEVWIADADGSNPVKLPARNCGFEGWSSDGRYIVYTDFDWDGVWVAAADGSDPIKLTDRAIFRGWSPDGQYVTYNGWTAAGKAEELWVAAADGSDPIKLTDRGYYEEWSPDGRYVTYRLRSPDGHYELWVAAADGSKNPVKLTDRGSHLDSSFSRWSPGSQYVAYSVSSDTTYEMWVAAADGSDPIKVTDRGWFASGATGGWSPDDRYVVYKHQTAAGKTELWVAAADGSKNPVKLTDHGRVWGWVAAAG